MWQQNPYDVKFHLGYLQS